MLNIKEPYPEKNRKCPGDKAISLILIQFKHEVKDGLSGIPKYSVKIR